MGAEERNPVPPLSVLSAVKQETLKETKVI